MFGEFELDTESVPLYKLVVHIAQIVLVAIAWILEITVFRADKATVNGQCGWVFAVCFLTIPAWIYLIGAPRFPRTRRFAEPHVMVAIDSLYTLIWLSAFSAQAAYNTSGKCGTGCGRSKGIVALGVFVTIFFGVSTFLSIITLKFYQFNGRLPGYDRLDQKGNVQDIDPDMAAFSMAPHDEEPYARVNDNDNDYDHDMEHGGYDSHMASRPGDDYHTTVSSSYGGASSVTGGGSTAYMGAGSQVDTGYGGAANSLVSTTGYGGSYSDRSHLGAHDNNPFDDGRSAVSASSAAGHSSYVSTSVHDEYDDGRPGRY